MSLRTMMTAIHGTVDRHIAMYAASQLETLLLKLLEAAITGWAAEGFIRYSDSEVSCSIRVYDWSRRVLLSTPKLFPQTRIQYDGPAPSAQILAGLQNPMLVKRPDFTIIVGRVEVSVEAKRLSKTSPLPANYVKKGISRFTTGAYAVGAASRGAMISYNLKHAPREGVKAVNKYLCGAPDFGPTHTLQFGEKLASRVTTYTSAHGLPYELLHFAIDMT